MQLKLGGQDAAAVTVVQKGLGLAQMNHARDMIRIEVERLHVAREAVLEAFNARLLRAAAILVLILATVVCMAVHAWRSLSAAARRNDELAKRLAMEASHDALTGLPNRRFFDKWGAAWSRRASAAASLSRCWPSTSTASRRSTIPWVTAPATRY